MFKKIIYLMVIVIVCSVSGSVLAEDLTVQGSSTVLPIAQKSAANS